MQSSSKIASIQNSRSASIQRLAKFEVNYNMSLEAIKAVIDRPEEGVGSDESEP